MGSVDIFGESFELRPKVSEYALGKFAQAAVKGESAGMDSIGAMMDLIEKCIIKEDWERFDAAALENDASFEELTAVLDGAFHQEAERPTSLPSDSSDGQKRTAPRSVSHSAAKGLERLTGRPDLQVAAMRAKTA